MRWLLLCGVMGCATTRATPQGLMSDPDDVALSERRVKEAARVREVGATIASVGAVAGTILLMGSQLQPVQTVDPSFGTVPVDTQLLQQRAVENRNRDRTIASTILLSSIGVFLGACIVSAFIDGGSSEWLAEQRALEARQLAPVEAEANQKLYEAAKKAQGLAPEPGTTTRPGQRAPRRRTQALPLLQQ